MASASLKSEALMPARFAGAPVQFRHGRVFHAFAPRRIRNRLDAMPESLARVGSLEARIAQTSSEVRLAQSLRYRVFYEEMNAVAGHKTALLKRDADRFDRVCDHVLVIDHDADRESGIPQVVGTYRLLPHERAHRTGGFYTQREYAIDDLLAANRTLRFLELGRSCVLASHRNRRVLEVLWAGIWTYVRLKKVDAMFGCASFPGTNIEDHAPALAYLHHQARAPDNWGLRALPDLFQPLDCGKSEQLDHKSALKAMPALIKGYLRLGARVGDGAVIDRQFSTVDICMVLMIDAIDPRYFDYFGAPDASV